MRQIRWFRLTSGFSLGLLMFNSAWARSIPLSVDDIMDLVRNGVNGETLGSVVSEEGVRFQATETIRKQLRDAGVPDQVLSIIEERAVGNSEASGNQREGPERIRPLPRQPVTLPKDASTDDQAVGAQSPEPPQRHRGRTVTVKEPASLQWPKVSHARRSTPVDPPRVRRVLAMQRVPKQTWSVQSTSNRTVTERLRRTPLGESPLLTDDTVYVPGGEFWMRCNPRVDSNCESAEIPGLVISLDEFRIDRNEVTVRDYQRCVERGDCAPPDRYAATGAGAATTLTEGCNWSRTGFEQHPMNCVSWRDAQAYCYAVGKRLPTAAEWERAARGVTGFVYTWGNSWDANKANVSGGGTRPVGSYPAGASPYGVLDMTGNVAEWVGDWYESSVTDPPARGGSWGSSPTEARTSALFHTPTEVQGHKGYWRDAHIGFRCVD